MTFYFICKLGTWLPEFLDPVCSSSAMASPSPLGFWVLGFGSWSVVEDAVKVFP